MNSSAFTDPIHRLPRPSEVSAMAVEDVHAAFVLPDLIQPGQVVLRFTDLDRMVVGVGIPTDATVALPDHPESGMERFLDPHELGLINVGGPGTVCLDGQAHRVDRFDGVYVSRGTRTVTWASDRPEDPRHGRGAGPNAPLIRLVSPACRPSSLNLTAHSSMRSINGSLLLVTRRCVNALLCLLSVATGALANLDPQAFRNPPASSRPLTWMHMMNGNMSADGIARDMQALADAGVGGALLFSLGRNTTRGPVEFLSPEFERVVATAAVDLGKVHVLAEVTLNGRSCGTLWYPPYEVDVAQAVRPGHNELEIRVTNLWPNRIIADEALPPDVEWKGRALADWPDWLKEGRARPPTGRVAFFTWRHWQKDDPLLPSGLVGPVLLRGGTRAEFAPRSP